MSTQAKGSWRHCMVVISYYPLAETRVQREAEALVAQGYDVDVLCLRGPGESPEERYRSVQIYRLPVKRKKGKLFVQLLNYVHFFVLALWTLTRLHLSQRYDTIQVHNLPDFLVFCAVIPKLMGLPIILDLHDLMPEFYAGRFGNNKTWLRRFVLWQERLSCRFADHVITVSEHWRQSLIERGVPPEKCSVVMNVADTNIFHPPAQEPPAHIDRFRLIYHGTIVYRYGLDLAIQAVDRVRHDIPNIELILLGAGDYVSDLVDMVRERDLEDYVIFEAKRPAEALSRIILSADLGIVPYRNDVFTDGLLPTKLMEYAALGLPAIAARTTAIEAYFKDTMVEFFEPEDVDDLARCICMLYENSERLTELARGSEKFNRRYNWTDVSAEYVALVERLGTK